MSRMLYDRLGITTLRDYASMANLERRNEPNGLVFELQLQGLDSFPGYGYIRRQGLTCPSLSGSDPRNVPRMCINRSKLIL